MFGSVERPDSWARHMIVTRDLQKETGGFTEFVPLPFVYMEAPIYQRRKARRGPTFRRRSSCTPSVASPTEAGSTTCRPDG